MNAEKETTPVQVCDYKPLRECLDKHQGDRSKCLKEWEEFKTACSGKSSGGLGPTKRNRSPAADAPKQ
ncbi:uncharacterized protein BJ171DRAFT_182893 [Polychytrium aggregatum]|uniref:uncharacterized protein n=1 Tax=Polychytrium aggregatum TaxID=110093 RepID=UPI0022FDF35E|nr:uncharacterized protein BJ171DRAFT_182893 [Polychytrium aggregatum]KAI9202304.1 hypothetical protein BJ171DRAFT_182893 [Polychytrium aggregatum]